MNVSSKSITIFFCFVRENKNGLVGQKWYASNYHKKAIYNELDISEEIAVWVCAFVWLLSVQMYARKNQKEEQSNAILWYCRVCVSVTQF